MHDNDVKQTSARAQVRRWGDIRLPWNRNKGSSDLAQSSAITILGLRMAIIPCYCEGVAALENKTGQMLKGGE
jgi:hypothetical protein